uniref:Uncharacterized protein n=1 Tax=Arundo donax TaxID=35708 RepID=A0A0A9MYL0_ARUDO
MLPAHPVKPTSPCIITDNRQWRSDCYCSEPSCPFRVNVASSWFLS